MFKLKDTIQHLKILALNVLDYINQMKKYN